MTDGRETISFKFDGKELTAFKGETVLMAALRNGAFIPHYCWHPGLSIAGNCRMCLVYTVPGPPKPQIACSTEVTQGMEVESASERVKTDREGVLEFLLANHPLDCPVCDQAGECDLQQYSFDHGRASSQFVEEKTQRPRKDFGPLIRFVGNRCIVCTRCVRFTDEVTGTGELTVVNRTDASYIDVFPGEPLDNPMSGCTADLCPVGALLETDSVHSTRVWLLRGTKSVCGSCSTGCNVNVETFDEEVQRLTPRENQAVNRWWMCDPGRLSYHEAQAEGRLRAARVDGQEVPYQQALDRAADLFREAATAREPKVAGLATGYATNEELYVFAALVGKGALGVAYRPDGPTFHTTDGFEIRADKNPNRGGVTRLLGQVGQGEAVTRALEAGQVSLLLVLDAVPGGAPFSADLLAAAAKADALIVIGHEDSALARAATVALPALHWTEKDGTFVNARGRLQRARAATPPPGDARADLEALQELGRAAGIVPRVVSAGGVFRRLAAAQPGTFGGLDYHSVGEVGVPLPGAEDTVPPAEARSGYEAGPVSRQPGRALDEQTRISVHREAPAGYGTLRGSD